jgi:hypothetical protein
MTPSDSPPKLPLWIFLATDALLIAAAAIIRAESRHPLSNEAVFAIVGCLVAGAIVAFVPLIARYERAKNETLDERQRSLEALARTLGSAAEQISIAVGGLHEIADLAQKNLKHAEQLPHKLQDKIAEFQAQLKDANDTEKEELEKEVAELRASESERLETVAGKVTKAVAEFARLEAATAQHLTAANDAVAKLSFAAAGAIGKAQAAAEQAFAQARTEAARGLGESAGAATKAVEAAKAAALAEIAAAQSTASTPVAAAATNVTAVAEPAPGATSETASPPKRPRKRREESAAPDTAAVEDGSPKIQAPDEPPPIPTENISEVAPVAPHTSEPFGGHLAAKADAAAPAPDPVAPAAADSPAVDAAAAETPKAPRKRTPKKADAAAEAKEEPALNLGGDEAADRTATELVERVLSSDGATRLLVTAYIGIGNRLFIRGAGPGLSWDKGTPLQFVSIGKWRWETNDANGPVQFKLYKNDDVECAALGAQKLDPGYQQEVTAAF